MESAAGAKQPTIDQTTAAHINILEMPQSVDAWPEQSSHRTDRSDAKSLQNKKIKKKKQKQLKTHMDALLTSCGWKKMTLLILWKWRIDE